jgi:hypothetical protein
MENNIKRIRDQTVEEFTRVEELCSMVSFFFSKLYNIETFKEKSKYFVISKQLVFYALQRSLGRIEPTEKNLDCLLSLNVINRDFLDRLLEIKKKLQYLETLYYKNRIKEVVDQLLVIGKDIDRMKTEFKSQLE